MPLATKALKCVPRSKPRKSIPFLFVTYAQPNCTTVLTSPNRTNQYIAAGLNLPKYLCKIGYKEPTAAEANNHSDGDPDGLNFFGRLQKSPDFYEAFTGHMEAWTAWKTPWTKLYDPSKLPREQISTMAHH